MRGRIWKSYGATIVLLLSVVAGVVAGLLLRDRAGSLKPYGDVFLNLLFTAVVPLVFFSIGSAVAGMTNPKRLGRIFGTMLAVFVATGVIASLLMIGAVVLYPPAQGLEIELVAPGEARHLDTAEQIVAALTVPDFVELLSKKHMLALIVFAVLVGLATSSLGERGQAFAAFLRSANDVMLRVIGYIMYYAPVGLFCYFAYLTGVFGPELLATYGRAMALYYPISLLYFFVAFPVYAYLAGGRAGWRRFLANVPPPALTAFATGSSMAAIPLNLEAARKSGVPRDIAEVVIPVGATIHMDGSCLSAVLKIAVLFGLFQMPFEGASTIATAVGIALLSGTVMSGIPGGGFIGEILIVTLYGFPPEALPVISMIGALVDPPATMVNAVGDNVSSMMVARLVEGRRWMDPVPHGEDEAQQ